MKLAQILQNNSDKEFQTKCKNYIYALTDKTSFSKFETHMNSILLPAISAYKEKALAVQT